MILYYQDLKYTCIIRKINKMNLKKIVIGLVILGVGYFAYTKIRANKNTTKIKEGSFTIEVEDEVKDGNA